MHEWLNVAIVAARMAGDVALKHYRQPLDIELKNDGSPLTIADQQAHKIIVDSLSCTQIPVVSEEGGNLHENETLYWLVDPLDGTKDFLAKNGEFTVNIALIEGNRPILGVVAAPAFNEIYFGGFKMGAWRQRQQLLPEALEPKARSATCRMAISRFHDHSDIDLFARQNNITVRVAIGSALKYAYLAAGEVDIFPRLVGSSEWDTAAGQALLEAAGGQVLDWHTGLALQYGKQRRRNPRLLALRSPYQRNEYQLMSYEPELL